MYPPVLSFSIFSFRICSVVCAGICIQNHTAVSAGDKYRFKLCPAVFCLAGNRIRNHDSMRTVADENCSVIPCSPVYVTSVLSLPAVLHRSVQHLNGAPYHNRNIFTDQTVQFIRPGTGKICRPDRTSAVLQKRVGRGDNCAGPAGDALFRGRIPIKYWFRSFPYLRPPSP